MYSGETYITIEMEGIRLRISNIKISHTKTDLIDVLSNELFLEVGHFTDKVVFTDKNS